MLRRSVLLVLVLLLCGREAALAEQTVVCATMADRPPMEFVDKGGNVAGYAIDLIRAAGRIAGFKAEFKTVARGELAAGLVEGKYDAICSSTELGEEAKKGMDITSPYQVAAQVLVVNSATRIYSTTDTVGLAIGVVSGSGTDPQLQGARIKNYDSLAEAMEDLYVSRLDGVVCDSVLAAYYSTVKYQNKLKVTGFLGQGNRIEYALAVKKGNSEVLALLNKGISTLQAREIDKELRLKWFSR